MRCSEAGREIIKRFEGLRLEAYRCPAGILTIGYGHTGDVKPGMRITEHQADAILDADLDLFDRRVTELTAPAAPTQNEFDACCSLAFNIGLHRFERSTLLAKLLARDRQGAAAEFLKWEYAAGKVLPGLVKRRAAERALFLRPL